MMITINKKIFNNQYKQNRYIYDNNNKNNNNNNIINKKIYL